MQVFLLPHRKDVKTSKVVRRTRDPHFHETLYFPGKRTYHAIGKHQ